MLTRTADFFLALGTGLAVATARGLATAMQGPLPFVPADAQLDILKLVLKEGSLFAVIVGLLYFYRRDFKTSSANQQAQMNALLHVVQANITAMQESKASTERLARAIEADNQRRLNEQQDRDADAERTGR